MDSIKQRQNLGYVIAGGGALVALLAFLLLPFVSVTLTTILPSSFGGSSNSSVYATYVLNATALTQSPAGTGSGINTAFHIALTNGQGILWLLPILALLALVLTGLLLYRDHPFGSGLSAPVANQKRWGTYALIGVAAVSILIAIITIANLNGQVQSYINSSSGSGSGSPSVSVSSGGHVGFWLYLLGIVALAGGAILMVVQANKQAQAVLSTSIPGGSPYQSWQSPAPLDPYSQQDGPQPYQPPQQPPYSSQQWPPSNPSQPPYPPGQ